MILGVRIDNLSREEIHCRIENILSGPPQHKFIVTLNPEIILKGHRDKIYAGILNSADLGVCDGFGIQFVSWIRGRKIKARYTGVDLVGRLLKTAKEKNQKVLVVVSKKSLSSPEKIEEGIEKKYNFKIHAKNWDTDKFFESDEVKEAEIILVNFGAPAQEEFIFENQMKFANAKVLAGVGGTFDFLTERIKRAPKGMQKIGLEWLWRLIQEPKRAKRIWNAVAIFPILALYKAKKCPNCE